MSFQENGLDLSILPPEGEKIAPGSNYKSRVTITNKRHLAGIRLEVSLDLPPELKQWCKNSSHKITISYQKSQEIEFLWNIPPQALPGVYNYNLRIRFLRSTSFYAVQPKRRQLTVLRTKVKPQVDNKEPTFVINPASSSTKPITLSSREILNLEIYVHNRSNRTDNYRISTDLDTGWYTIHYPETIKKVGAIDGNDALNLNPNKEGKINLIINPPADAVAGNYKPEIKLYSLNSPDLFLKKIIYLNIPPQYVLQAELQPVLNKVSYKKGRYKIILINQGNTFRAIDLKAYTSDEDECCEYYFKPSSIRLPPNKTREIDLEVQPNSQQKRPFLSSKEFNFQVDLSDKNNYPLPKNLPLKSSLLWRSRPLWQLILLFLLALGCISGIGWLIWKTFLQPEPKAEITFKPEKTAYEYEGDPIAVDWTVKNPQTLDKIRIFDQALGVDTINTKCYYFNNELNYNNCTLITQTNSLNTCPEKNNTICHQDIFGYAEEVQEYIFKLEAFDRQGEIIKEQTINTSILPRKTFEIIESTITVTPPQATYKPTDEIKLKFQVAQFNSLKDKDKISLLINDKVITTIDSTNKKEYCSSASNPYNCVITIKKYSLKEGENTLRIKTEYDDQGLIKNDPKTISVPKSVIVQTPIEFVSFTINGRSNPQIEVEPNTSITVSWSVRGTEVKANLSCIPTNIPSSGSRKITVLPGKSESCILTASDKHGNSITPKKITVFVKELPKPEPEETQSSPTIIENPFGL